MIFFNLKRLAKLLAILLAILPVSNLVAASPVVTASMATSILQKLNSATRSNVLASDAANILTLAGYPGGLQSALTAANVSKSASMAQTCTTTLTSLFNTSMKKYSSNISSQVIQNLYTTYNQQAQSILTAINNKQAPTVSSVNGAMQNLVILLSATMYAYSKQFINSVRNLALPLTGQTIMPTGSAVSIDQYVLNNFVQELYLWIPYYVAAVTNNSNAITNNALQLAAAQLKLTPPAGTSMAMAMQNVINAATNDSSGLYGIKNSSCSTNVTLQKEINCAISWYQAQLSIITNTINSISNADTALNSAVISLKSKLNGYNTTYTSQINASTTVANATSLFNTALANINAIYPSIINVISSQNQTVSNLEKAVNSAITTLTNACPSTPLASAMLAYNGTSGAQTSFAADYQTAITNFPSDLPASLTATTAANYSSSLPGSIILDLYNAQQKVISTINTNNTNNANNATVASATANAAALNKAVSTAQSTITTDQNTGIANIDAASGSTAISSALSAAITQVNTDYQNTIQSTSAYSQALASATTLLTQLQALPTTTKGVNGAITTMKTTINAANAAFPQATPMIDFTIAANQTKYATSAPGVAIAALNNAVNAINSGNTTVSSATANAAALNKAVSTAQNTITTDQTNGITSINSASGASAKAAALSLAITQVNTDYQNIIAATSTYSQALASANTLLTQLQALPTSTKGVKGAISTMNTAISAANAAFPVDTTKGSKGIVFSVANSTGAGASFGTVTAAQMVASAPGLAIAALNAAVNSTPTPGGGGGLSNSDKLAIGLPVAILGVILIGFVTKWGISTYKAMRQRQQEIKNSSDMTETQRATSEVLEDVFGVNNGGSGDGWVMAQQQVVDSVLGAADAVVESGNLPTPAQVTSLQAQGSQLQNAVENASEEVEAAVTTVVQATAVNAGISSSNEMSTNLPLRSTISTLFDDGLIDDIMSSDGVIAGNLPLAREIVKDYLSDSANDVSTLEDASQEVIDMLRQVTNLGYSNNDILNIINNDLTSTNSIFAEGTSVSGKLKKLVSTLNSQELKKPASGDITSEDFINQLRQAIAVPQDPVNVTNIGGPGQNIEGAKIFNKLAQEKGKVEESGILEELQLQGITAAQFELQMQALVAQRESLLEQEDVNEADIEALNAQIEAGNLAGETRFNLGSGEGEYTPVE